MHYMHIFKVNKKLINVSNFLSNLSLFFFLFENLFDLLKQKSIHHKKIGQTRRNNTALEYSGTGGATGESPHPGRMSFFSKLSSRFSKR